MRKLSTFVFVALLTCLVGCNNGTTTGGPGATTPNKGSTLTQAENTFELKPPLLETTVKQGESKTIKLGISRGKNFAQNVKLEFTGAPQGVKITPAGPDFKASAEEVQVTVEAAKDAAIGHHTITVTGTPATGAKGATTFKIEVEKP